MTDNEKLVRETWELAECLGAPRMRFVSIMRDLWAVEGNWATDEEAWKGAADFTRERLKEIADLGAEVDALVLLLRLTPNRNLPYSPSYVRRTISRLEKIRDDLKRGMK